MKSILGISAFYHDSAACILIDGKILAAAQEERFTRKKHDSSYPRNAIEFVLDYAKLKLSEVDQIIFFEKPFLKFERLLETYVAFAPKGFVSFSKAMPIWLKEKLFQKNLLFNGELVHSYPHSWRSKAPLVHRATPQWFISMESHKLRDKALKAIDETTFYPSKGKERLISM